MLRTATVTKFRRPAPANKSECPQGKNSGARSPTGSLSLDRTRIASHRNRRCAEGHLLLLATFGGQAHQFRWRRNLHPPVLLHPPKLPFGYTAKSPSGILCQES